MDQLIFKFPFSKKYYEQDFFVSSNNFSAFKLIEDWPSWPGKWLNIFGASGSGKTHLAKILEKKIDKIKLIDAKNVDNKTLQDLSSLDCLIIDSFDNNIDEKLLYSILNQSKQLESYVLINSSYSIQNIEINLKDLKSRINSFIYIGIELPTDDLLRVIISKTLSDNQVNINPKVSDFHYKECREIMKKCLNF